MSDRLIHVTSISPRLIGRPEPTGLSHPDNATGATRYQVWLAKSDTFTFPTAAEARQIAAAWVEVADHLAEIERDRVADHARSEVELTDEEADRIAAALDELAEDVEVAS